MPSQSEMTKPRKRSWSFNTSVMSDTGVTPAQVDRVIFVGGPTRMPAVRAFFEQLLGRSAEMGVDRWSAWASGAAIQDGVLSGEMGEIVLVDVTPLTLGVETLGGIATPLIERNTPSQCAGAKYSPRPRTCRPPSPFTSSRASGPRR
jgi:molecular chaperone DnaK (HSP70)